LAWVLAGLLTTGATTNRSPEGNWLTTDNGGVVEIFRCADGETLCGKLAWFRMDPGDPNPEALDLRNPDPTRRARSLCGLMLMSGFKRAGDGSWEDGTVYDAESGNTYRATLTLQADGRLSLRGYIGIPLFGRSEVWTRDTEPVPTCPTR
jgi:uncharacterized protein (DUF2147 family)